MLGSASAKVKEQGDTMEDNFIFSPEELKSLAADPVAQIKDAIDAGNSNLAKELINKLYDSFVGLHDGSMIWIAALLSHIYNNYGGSDAVEAAEREAHTIESHLAAAFKPSGVSDLRSRMINLLRGIKGHVHQPMTISEDAQKITITVEPCGSGGRLIAMGGYNSGTGLVRITHPHNITWQQPDFPIYCVHCPIMGALTFERDGDFSFVKTFQETAAGSRCQYHFYKNPQDIPEEFYTRIGKQRPSQDAG
jgi:hypothetical protein